MQFADVACALKTQTAIKFKETVMRQLEGYQVILRDSTKWMERSRSIK